MQDKNFKRYSKIGLNQSSQIQYSKLYSLAPIGIGTPFVESLTSYISRLAYAHCVYPGILMKIIIQSLIRKKYSSSNLYQAYSFRGVINGTGNMALDIGNALIKLTSQDKLQALNLTNFIEVIPSRNLLRKNKSWCSICYETWKSNEKIIYEPLIWTLSPVKICPTHKTPLQELCPYCKQNNFYLTWKTEPGYCDNCRKWLGKPTNKYISCQNKNTKEKLDWHLWVVNSLGELLAKNSANQTIFSKESVSQSLLLYANKKYEGNLTAFARYLKMPKNTVWLWCNRKNQPSLEMLLRISYYLDASLWDFFSQENFIKSEQQINTIASPPQLRSKAKSKSLDLDKMKKYLERVLEIQEVSPISMVQVAQESSFNRRELYKYFPEICKKISAKYSIHKTTLHKDFLRQSCEEVRDIIFQLHHEGKFPSERRVMKRMSKPGFLRYQGVKQCFLLARKELGI